MRGSLKVKDGYMLGISKDAASSHLASRIEKEYLILLNGSQTGYKVFTPK